MPSFHSPFFAMALSCLSLSPIPELAEVQNGITVLPVKSFTLTNPFTGHAAIPHQMGYKPYRTAPNYRAWILQAQPRACFRHYALMIRGCYRRSSLNLRLCRAFRAQPQKYLRLRFLQSSRQPILYCLLLTLRSFRQYTKTG